MKCTLWIYCTRILSDEGVRVADLVRPRVLPVLLAVLLREHLYPSPLLLLLVVVLVLVIVILPLLRQRRRGLRRHRREDQHRRHRDDGGPRRGVVEGARERAYRPELLGGLRRGEPYVRGPSSARVVEGPLSREVVAPVAGDGVTRERTNVLGVSKGYAAKTAGLLMLGCVFRYEIDVSSPVF